MKISPIDQIQQAFADSAHTIETASSSLATGLAQAAEQMLAALLDGRKVLTCGTGGSAACAQRLASQLIHRCQHERPSLPCIALTDNTLTLSGIAEDEIFSEIFAKPIQAIGQTQDILVTFSSTRHSHSILQAIDAAHTKDMRVVAMTGTDGGNIPNILHDGDIELRVPSNHPARIEEIHWLSLHCLCDLIDSQLFGYEEKTYA